MKLHGTQTGARDLLLAKVLWRRVKLHGTQTLQPLKITNVQVLKKIKLHSSQTEMVHLYYATNTKKLQGTQTQETQSDARHRV